jgi:enoyl-CoA hydratase/carnithine racemase
MVLTASVVSAEELLSSGGINRVTAPDRLLEEGRAYAQRLATGPTLAHKRSSGSFTRGDPAVSQRPTG